MVFIETEFIADVSINICFTVIHSLLYKITVTGLIIFKMVHYGQKHRLLTILKKEKTFVFAQFTL